MKRSYQWKILKVDDRVRVTRTITESGHLPGDPKAKFPSATYIHAVENDFGVVIQLEYLNGVRGTTVRFDRTGTSSIVGDDEIEKIEGEA